MLEFSVQFKGQGAVLSQLKKIKSGLERTKVLRLLAVEARNLIKNRTLDGLDENDRALIPSRRVKLHGGQTLSDKGHMLGVARVQGSMDMLNVNANRAVIGFGSALENKKAWWAHGGTKTKKGGVKSPRRPFFGISPANERDLQTECNQIMAETLAAAGVK